MACILPPEPLQRIFCALSEDTTAILNMERVCRTWAALFSEEATWHAIYLARWPSCHPGEPLHAGIATRAGGDGSTLYTRRDFLHRALGLELLGSEPLQLDLSELLQKRVSQACVPALCYLSLTHSQGSLCRPLPHASMPLCLSPSSSHSGPSCTGGRAAMWLGPGCRGGQGDHARPLNWSIVHLLGLPHAATGCIHCASTRVCARRARVRACVLL